MPKIKVTCRHRNNKSFNIAAEGKAINQCFVSNGKVEVQPDREIYL